MTTPTLDQLLAEHMAAKYGGKPTIEQIMTELRASTEQVNGDRRRVTSRFVLAELPDKNNETGRQAVVKVNTFHYGDRKRYSTSIMQVEVARGANFSVEKFSMFSGVGLTSTPVARHSAKAILAAHESGLQILEEALRQGNVKVVEQFQIQEQE
jgi:hypothetical protein